MGFVCLILTAIIADQIEIIDVMGVEIDGKNVGADCGNAGEGAGKDAIKA